jgi:hypothetical protein
MEALGMRSLKAIRATWIFVVLALPGAAYAQPAPAPAQPGPAAGPTTQPAPGEVTAAPAQPPPEAAQPAPAAPAPAASEPARPAPAAAAPLAPAPARAAAAPPAGALAGVLPGGPGSPVVAGTLPGSFKVPGTETSLRIYGHVHVDATFDITGRVQDYNNNDWSTNIFVQPLDDTPDPGARKEGQFFLTARTSRIGFATSTPTGIGDLSTKIEADFNGPNGFQSELATNSTVFRLRHAYGEVGGFLVGQTWSNFTDLGSFPDTVDFNPPGDTVLIRQAMLRYALPIGPTTLSAAIENSRSLTLNANSGPTVDTDRKWYQVPDATLNFTVPWSWGHLSARGVTLQYKVLDRPTKQGWGAALSGSLKFLGDNLVWGVQAGDGTGRYTFNAILQGGYDTGTEIQLWRTYGYHGGFTHNWSDNVRSNLIWSQTFFQRNNAILDATGSPRAIFNERIDQAFVNTFWGFVKNAEVGIEYAYGQRRTFDDQAGTQHRINATFHYNLL